ncbi:MAG: UDP-2,3-diacylglucosamine diphosphatase LpxI, partial [Oricola sp.]
MAAGTHEKSGAGRVAIVAGGGRIPVFVAERLAEAGRDPFVIAILGEAEDDLLRFPHDFVDTAQIGVLVSILKRIKPSEVVLVGGVRQRPDLRKLRPDWTTIRLAARMLQRLKAGDDTLLRGVVDIIEDAGFPVRGVHELVPDLLVARGRIAGPKPTKSDREAIAVAVKGALALGGLDAGQACVAVGKRVVALEGAEGTDAMLIRVAELRAAGRIKGKRGGVLVKLAKPGQDLRVDLPTIGETTVENAAKAGLRGIAVHAGHALVYDHAGACARADA